MSDNNGFLYAQNYSYLRFQLEKYKQNRDSVDEHWKDFFVNLGDNGIRDLTDRLLNNTHNTTRATTSSPAGTHLSRAVYDIIGAHRKFGALAANLDPLELCNESPENYDVLNPLNYCGNLNEKVDMNGLLGLQNASIGEVVKRLRELYCGTRSMEAMHISSLEEQKWLTEKYENLSTSSLDTATRQHIYCDLLETELFEQFLHVKFAGAKRFSIEGGETSMVVFESLVEHLAEEGFDEFVMGMPHRGRLNCLVKIVGKPYEYIISEFMDNPNLPDDIGVSGDVKYHLGASVERKLRNGKEVIVSLTPNPSHLESVNAVTMGRVRAKQALRGTGGMDKVVGILSHGDGSISGQGVVYESLQLSNLDGYAVGGMIHIVVNNQIGFTSERHIYSSTRHPTDIAKFIDVPIFHVNGDDPESAYLIAKIAAEYRSRFKKDVFINVVCYRKYGHNEGDEPLFTQPVMYKKITSRPSPVKLYEEHLIKAGHITQEFAENMAKEFRNFLADALSEKNTQDETLDWLTKHWSGIVHSNEPFIESDTAITGDYVSEISNRLFTLPEDFTPNLKIIKLLESRAAMLNNEIPLDWGTGEWLAIGSVLLDHCNVRISGQDSIRGTFSHRHSAITDSRTGKQHHLFTGLASANNVKCDVISSPVSEYAVLGYEFGYSNVTPQTLVIWEAQYGDFANVGQVIFDQFISSSELKWLRMSGLTVLLPHGYEGQGPEHSSARMERYLQLCAENNMRITNCTTPANYFHALRMQIVSNVRKPLIAFSPKSLLRHKSAVSDLRDFLTGGKFRYIIGDHTVNPEEVTRVILCCGKVYYDLNQARIQNNVKNIAIVRVEQLYPLKDAEILDELSRYQNAGQLIWCQEEPQNMGTWSYMLPHLLNIINRMDRKVDLRYVGRKESAATAVGYHSIHNKQQALLIDEAIY